MTRAATKIRADEVRAGDVIRWVSYSGAPWLPVEEVGLSKSGKMVCLANKSHPWQPYRESRVGTLIEVRRGV